jgi:hypothetical protein
MTLEYMKYLAALGRAAVHKLSGDQAEPAAGPADARTETAAG